MGDNLNLLKSDVTAQQGWSVQYGSARLAADRVNQNETGFVSGMPVHSRTLTGCSCTTWDRRLSPAPTCVEIIAGDADHYDGSTERDSS